MPHSKTHHVRISFRSPGTKPPVHIAGSFTDPSWTLTEMEHKPIPKVKDSENSDEFEFYGTYNIQEGDHQYKFRLGNGNWWVCDESSETVLDEAGNRNNLLRVEPQSVLKHQSVTGSMPEEMHAHAKAHVSWETSDLNPVWDLIGIDPMKAASGPRMLSPPIHEQDCPLREFHDPDHPKYTSRAANACQCGKPTTNTAVEKAEEERSEPDSGMRGGQIPKAEKPRRPSVIRLPIDIMREYQFIPAPENTPIFQGSGAMSPTTKSEMRNRDTGESQRTSVVQDDQGNGVNLPKEIHPQSKEIAPTFEEEKDIMLMPEAEERIDENDEAPRRRQLSEADIQSVRRSMTHLQAKSSNQDLVNSAESDTPLTYERDSHGDAPRFPHEALTPPSAHIPHSNTKSPRDTPKLFPQAYSRIPTISLYNDPILPAFPTGEHGLLSRMAAVASGKETFENQMAHEWASGDEPSSEEEEEPLSAMVHSPTFRHEVPLDYQYIRRQSTRWSLSFPTGTSFPSQWQAKGRSAEGKLSTDGASDPLPTKHISKTPTTEDITPRQTCFSIPRLGSLTESFAEIKRIDSFGREVEDDDTTPPLQERGSKDSLIESLSPRRASHVSFVTAHSRSSSCSSSGDETCATANVAFWRRMWQILGGWFASLWAAVTRKSVDDGVNDRRYYEAAKKHD